MMDDRAATETLGFILAFALVTTSIGIVYTAGFAGLQDARNAEQVANVERAFDVLAENFEELRRRGVPSRSTEIKLIQGDLTIAAPTDITINITGAPNTSVTAHPRPLTYASSFENTKISYVNGALFRTDNGNTVMLSEPGWIVDPNELLVIPIADTSRTRGPQSMGGRRTILVISRFQGRSTFKHVAATGTVTVEVTVESERVGAWKRYLEEKGFTPVDADISDNNITYSIEVERVYVPRTAIGIELTR